MTGPRTVAAGTAVPGALADLMQEGFVALALLREGRVPQADGARLATTLKSWLAGLDAAAARRGVEADDLRLARFAFAALADEIVLGSPLPVRDEWRRRPLQFDLFGEQLAGERFFEHVERLREQGARRLAALEIFHLCLLLGFKGRYALDGGEALGWLTARLGDEIARWRGGPVALSPNGAPPDRIAHRLRRIWPAWAGAVVVGCVALFAFGVLQADLARQGERALGPHRDVVRALPAAAHLTITLP